MPVNCSSLKNTDVTLLKMCGVDCEHCIIVGNDISRDLTNNAYCAMGYGLLQRTCAFRLGRFRRSPAPAVRRLAGAEEASVRLRCVDPSCTRTAPRSPPVVVRS